MPDAAPITLDYANPRAAQPPGSTFAVDTFDDGVELTRPLPPGWATAVALAAVAAGTLVITGVEVFDHLADRHADRGEWPVQLVVVLLLVGIAAWLLRAASTTARPRVQRVTLRGDRLTAVHCLWTVTGRPWSTRRARRAVAVSAGSDVLTGRRLGAVAVNGPLGIARCVLTNVPYDECVWIAAVLNAALPPRR